MSKQTLGQAWYDEDRGIHPVESTSDKINRKPRTKVEALALLNYEANHPRCWRDGKDAAYVRAIGIAREKFGCSYAEIDNAARAKLGAIAV